MQYQIVKYWISVTLNSATMQRLIVQSYNSTILNIATTTIAITKSETATSAMWKIRTLK